MNIQGVRGNPLQTQDDFLKPQNLQHETKRRHKQGAWFFPKICKKLLVALMLCCACLVVFFMNCSLTDDLNVGSVSVKPPDLLKILNELAQKYQNDLNNACNDETFLDAIVARLRQEADPVGWRFGYFCINNDCDNISNDQVAFRNTGTNTPENKTAIAIQVLEGVNPCTANPRVAWNIKSEVGGWIYPREKKSTEPCTGLECNQNPKDPKNPGRKNECKNGQFTVTGRPCGPNTSGEECINGINQVTGLSCGNRVDIHVDNFHDGFDFDQITWLHANMKDWNQNSQITAVEFQQNDQGQYNGQICIRYNRPESWTDKSVSLSSFDSQLLGVSSGSYAGNASVIMKVSGKYYGGTFDWISSSDSCILKDVSSLAEAYASEIKSIGFRVQRPPLEKVALQPGDIIGFMVSSLGRNNVRSDVSERSDIYWMVIPSADGSIPPQHIPTPNDCESEPNSLLCQSESNCYVSPHTATIIEDSSNAYATDLQNACQEDNWEFLDKVTLRLHFINQRFGYSTEGGSCPETSENQITHSCDSEEPRENQCETSTSVKVFDVIEGCPGNPFTQWEDVSDTVTEKWKYPREAEISGIGSCTQEQIDAGWISQDDVCEARCSLENLPGSLPEFDSVVEFGTNESQCSETENPDLNFLQITAPTQTESCCRRTRKTCNSQAIALGYRTVNGDCYPGCSFAATLAGYEPQTGSNSNVSVSNTTSCNSLGSDWKSVDFYDPYVFGQRSTATQVADYFERAVACCVKGDATGTPATPHDAQGLYHPGAGVPLPIPPGECPEGATYNAGDGCSDTTNFNIHADPQTGGCCRTPRTGPCPEGDYVSTNGNCYPKCAYAVELAGYSTALLIGQGSACEDSISSGSDGHDDWTSFSFWDEYQMKWSDNKKVSGVIGASNRNCCKRGDSSGDRATDPWGDHPDPDPGDVDPGPPAGSVTCEQATQGLNGVARGDDCQSNNHNILEFNVAGNTACCIRTNKTSCPAGYELKDGECLPDCGTAAELVGYSDADKHILTGKKDYPVDQRSIFRGGDRTERISTCEGLNKIEQENCGKDVKGLNCETGWKDFNFWDSHRLKYADSKSEIREVNDNYMCCVRGTASDQVAQPPCHSEPAEGAAHCTSE